MALSDPNFGVGCNYLIFKEHAELPRIWVKLGLATDAGSKPRDGGVGA